jgi:hypothetical protein
MSELAPILEQAIANVRHVRSGAEAVLAHNRRLIAQNAVLEKALLEIAVHQPSGITAAISRTCFDWCVERSRKALADAEATL